MIVQTRRIAARIPWAPAGAAGAPARTAERLATPHSLDLDPLLAYPRDVGKRRSAAEGRRRNPDALHRPAIALLPDRCSGLTPAPPDGRWIVDEEGERWA